MQKINAKEDDDESSENEDLNDEIDNDDDVLSENLSGNDEKEDLLIDFNENNDENEEKNKDNKGGVFDMKFMQKSQEFDKNINLKDKMKKVLSSSKKEDQNLDMDKGSEDEIDEKMPNKSYARQKFLENDETGTKKKNKRNKEDSNIINADALKEINNDAKIYAKELDNKIAVTEEDYKKIIELDNINNENEFINKFLVKNKQNEIEFFEEQKSKAVKNLEEESKCVQGWDSWAGDTKIIQSKQYLMRKRQQERVNKLLN